MKSRSQKSRTTVIALLLAGSAMLGGCNTTNTIRPTGPVLADGTVPFEHIVTNGWLKYKANIVGVHEATVNGDMKRIAVDVYSDQLNPQRFTYKFDWLDASGLPVPSPTTTSTSVTIKPKETITLTSVSPSPAATNWRLTFIDEQR